MQMTWEKHAGFLIVMMCFHRKHGSWWNIIHNLRGEIRGNDMALKFWEIDGGLKGNFMGDFASMV
jgi:hypothetical protein